MTRDELQQWERARALGRKKFIWKKWVIGWGMFMFVAMTLVNTGMDILFYEKPFDFMDLLGRMVIAITIFPLAGYAIGAWMWSDTEKRYQREKHKLQTPAMQ